MVTFTCVNHGELEEKDIKLQKRVNKDGDTYYAGRCRTCSQIKDSIHYAKNKERKLAYGKEYKEKNREALKVKAKEWKEKNPEKYREGQKNWEGNTRKFLRDRYVKKKLTSGITPKVLGKYESILIEVKRELLKLHRATKVIKNEKRSSAERSRDKNIREIRKR